MLLDHVCLLVSQVHLIVQEVLGVCQILNGPSLLLGFLGLPDALIVLDLLCSCGINLVNGFGLEALEVVRNVSVPAKLRGGSHWILSHEVIHVSTSNLLLVHVLLVVSPGLLTVPLLLSKHLIILLEVFELLIFLLRHLILQNPPHPRNSFSLLSIGRLLVLQRRVNTLLLGDLPLAPLFLDRIVQVQAVAVVFLRK